MTPGLNSHFVWDLPLRVFHWLLVVSLVASYIAVGLGEVGLGEVGLGSAGLYWHLQIGVFIFALIIFRLCWGILGSETAQFKSFIPSPERIKQVYFYKKNTTGHSPHGAIAAFILILLVLVQTLTGLFAIDDDIDIAGPLNEMVSDSTANLLSSLHSSNFDVLIMMIGLHILAVIFYRLIMKTNLITPMITGYAWLPKAEKNKAITSEKKSDFFSANLVVSLLISSAVYWGVESGQLLSLLVYLQNYFY